jgi:hypothetical protein
VVVAFPRLLHFKDGIIRGVRDVIHELIKEGLLHNIGVGLNLVSAGPRRK